MHAMAKDRRGHTQRTEKIVLTFIPHQAGPVPPPLGGSLEALKRGLEEALKELRPDPRQQGSGRTLHAFGGDSLLIFGDGGHHCGTGLSERSVSLPSRAAGSKIPGNFRLLKFPGSLLVFSPASLLCLQRGALRRRTGVRQSFAVSSVSRLTSRKGVKRVPASKAWLIVCLPFRYRQALPDFA